MSWLLIKKRAENSEGTRILLKRIWLHKVTMKQLRGFIDATGYQKLTTLIDYWQKRESLPEVKKNVWQEYTLGH